MKKKRTIKIVYDYVCSVCGKPIVEDRPIIVRIKNTFNMGEDGDVEGFSEWHLHQGEEYSSCKSIFQRHIEEKFKAQDLDTLGDNI